MRLSRKWSRAPAALALALALLASATARADAPRTLDPAELAPTQTTLGYEVAKDNLRNWEAKAKKTGLSLEQYASDVLKPKAAKRKTPVIIDPEGRVRNADSHHRVWALQTLQAKVGVKLDVGIEVLKDFRGYSHEKYAAKATKLLGLRLREGQSPEEAIDALPKSYAELKDSPMRSLVGKAFKSAGLKGKWFKNYVQFDVASRLMTDGLLGKLKEKRLIAAGAREVPASAAGDPQVLYEVQTMMFESKDVRNLLKERARSKKRKKVQKKLKKARAAHAERAAPEPRARRSKASSKRGYAKRLKTPSRGRTARRDHRPKRRARGQQARKARGKVRARAR